MLTLAAFVTSPSLSSMEGPPEMNMSVWGWFVGEAAPELEEDTWGAELHGTCDCWNTTEDGRHVEVECRCGGQELTDIPSSLASDVHRM
ncbi:hypothetical protein C0J52_22523 [Blattella germanica]|nr:hypothetical protein C0J52_22523 [Blattella germanica]